VSSIAVDSDGHVWVGTFGGGVSRFDGQEWFTYSTGHGLAGDWVTAVVVDTQPPTPVWLTIGSPLWLLTALATFGLAPTVVE
jgi:ligand-binding sensor domain-containing protein